jgi:hypothetical protein
MNVMGVDVGDKLHVVLRGRERQKWQLQEAFTADTFEELERCFKHYKIVCCVVDGRPEARETRRFQDKHVGTVWLAEYTAGSGEPEWVTRNWLVKAPRTGIMDETFRRFREREYLLPTYVHEIEGGEYVKHLLEPARHARMDSAGRVTNEYKNKRADDFAHAEVYATLAVIRATKYEGSVMALQFGPYGTSMTRLDGSDYLRR